jgi:cell wall-associated NlpC family hydrolase
MITNAMPVKREQFVGAARKYIGVPFSHQGRDPFKTGLDCGGLILVVARELELTELEELGYAAFPTDGRFDQLLEEYTDFLGFESKYPHRFDGTEFKPGDLLSFDYENGEGTRHIAVVTKFDGRRFSILDANPTYGVKEFPLGHPFSKAKIKGWRVRGLSD